MKEKTLDSDSSDFRKFMLEYRIARYISDCNRFSENSAVLHIQNVRLSVNIHSGDVSSDIKYEIVKVLEY